MTMVKTHVSTHEWVAGRYRLLDVVHRETNRVSWYGEYVEETGAARPCLVTRIGLPADQGEEKARQAADRVLRMSETMARLCPGRIASVVDALEEEGSLWTVTEWIDGLPLGQLIAQKGAFSPGRAAAIGLQLLDVLEVAHGEGITHGELSPGQIFVRSQGPLVLTGFGLAGATLAPRVAAPSYASPEQARDERIGPAADLWTLGALLYTMVEGRPPYRDRDRPEATLKGVDRLPLRAPLRAGPLTPVVQGLLRKDSRERLTRTVVRQSLTRLLDDDPHAAVPAPRLRRVRAAARHMGPQWSGRAMAAGTALAVVTVALAALAVAQGLPDGDDTAAGDAQAQPSATATAPGEDAGDRVSATPDPAPTPTPAPSRPASPSPSTPPRTSPSPPATADALPDGFRVYHADEGFSVALPKGWQRLNTARASDGAYRVTFGAKGDPRTLAVTYSKDAGPDPVAVWRDDVEPNLRRTAGFRRIGQIRATTYLGYKGADMEWLSDGADGQERTFGRGFLLGGHRSFSLRWTTPAADWNTSADRQALDTFLKTFRPGSAA
ncbi:serine/threonine-protein kinase [Streptomyces sp. NBC_00199]|uniref:serine/threonine protein kinase n=1 Tax=Streptomyces sp. NBC_00199 TaxID=2975678 RepID=UPI00225A820E|nr:serine/threonine-protein kinase [Streptomyces sp. NBC_00199]MCX5263922.1 serine/threonine protein kinase [Streptomyces sp. NBC_00199]